MIPRLKPFIGSEEFLSLFQTGKNAVEKFESAFAAEFSTRHALAFPYGRSALWAFFKAWGSKALKLFSRLIPARWSVMPQFSATIFRFL